jgi:hypothetical protein
MASNGCDSIVTSNVTVSSPIDITVTNTTATLTITANNSTATAYQWIDCATGMPISGETNQSIVVTANGEYAVIVFEGNCSDTSDCITYATIGLEDKIANSISIYPNPSNGKVTIAHITDNFKVYDIRVLNLLGQSVYKEVNLSNSSLELNIEKKGVYFVEISNGNEQYKRKLIVK